MKELIEKIFSEQGFKAPQNNGSASFFEKQHEEKIEYYLVDFLGGEELKGYLEGESGQKMFSLFEENRKKKGDVEKNTSLVLCVRLENFKSDLQIIRNEILAVEENDYWFKKYIIVYTDTAVIVPSDNVNILVQLNRLLLEEGRFKNYKDDIYLDESYFVAIQLFTKLPFLLISQQSHINYRTINDLLKEQLTEDELVFRETLKGIEELDNDDEWKLLATNALDTSGDDKQLQSFILKFEANA